MKEIIHPESQLVCTMQTESAEDVNTVYHWLSELRKTARIRGFQLCVISRSIRDETRPDCHLFLPKAWKKEQPGLGSLQLTRQSVLLHFSGDIFSKSFDFTRFQHSVSLDLTSGRAFSILLSPRSHLLPEKLKFAEKILLKIHSL